MGRRRGHAHVPREGHEADAEPRRGALEERLRGRLRGIEPRRGDVTGEHRARGVDDEDDCRVLDRSGPTDVRPGERRRRGARARQRGAPPGVPPEPRRAGRDVAEHVDVRVADDVAGPPARQDARTRRRGRRAPRARGAPADGRSSSILRSGLDRIVRYRPRRRRGRPPGVYAPRVILSNGVVRTMDPVAADGGRARDRGRADRRRRRDARARAADSRAGRPPRPLRRSPPSPTRTSTSPRGRSRAATSSSRAPARSTRRSSASPPTGRAASGSAATAGATPSGRSSRRAQALDAVTGETPAALWSKDYHSLWLNTRRARARRRRPRGSGRRRGARRGGRADRASCARSRRGGSATSTWRSPRTSGSPRRATGLRIAAARGVGAIHDKDGWLGAPRASSDGSTRAAG